MKITHIYAENYKTYRNLDLDLSVEEDRPIILVGGGNGCGKTTLFDAISRALYGLDIKNARDFAELFNSGVQLEKGGLENQQIVLEIRFEGIFLDQATPCKLRRTYRYTEGKVQWSVDLNMNGNPFRYGNATPAADRANAEEVVNKIIAANLPQELSDYFLFDAMKTSDLVKEQQINNLIMKNINSVMGFNRYAMLRKASEHVLEQKKSSRLENENQRKEFEALLQSKKEKEEQLEKIRVQHSDALSFSTEHKRQYEMLEEGKMSDESTGDKIKQKEEDIKRVEEAAASYNRDMDTLMKNLETNVLFPKLASEIKSEVELIIDEKSSLEKEKSEMVSDAVLEEIVQEVLKNLSQKYPELLGVDSKSLTANLQRNRKKGQSLSEKYSNLSKDDVDTLKRLIQASYINQFVQLDNNRENIIMEVRELDEQKQLLEEYKRALSGNDYTFLARYEVNEQKIKELKKLMDSLSKDIKLLNDKISNYDYDIPQVPDRQYDLLCKLPDFLKKLSSKLLAAKRKSIEDMMKDQLNVNLVAYAGVIGRVSLEGATTEEINFKIYHKNGNEIYLSQLNAGAKQTLMQVLLKVLYELGDYNPPVMIDTVMGVLDKESRDVIIENYFPNLAEQTILLSTDTEITAEKDFVRLAPFIAKTYTLHRDKEAQCTTISNDYFDLTLNEL